MNTVSLHFWTKIPDTGFQDIYRNITVVFGILSASLEIKHYTTDYGKPLPFFVL